MTDAKTRQSRSSKAKHSPRAREARAAASYERRLKAAGIDPEEVPADPDEFRGRLARQIAMYLNTWRGCPELLCRRNRGCMAPNMRCSNVEELSPEEEERQWREVQADVHDAIQAAIAERGLRDE